MLTAYYSRGCDSEAMFAGLEISKSADFKKHLNKYDVIHIDVQWFLANCGDAAHVVAYITSSVLAELREIYPTALPSEVSHLSDALSRIREKTGQKFIIIIDEWDALIRDPAANSQVQDSYITFFAKHVQRHRTDKVHSAGLSDRYSSHQEGKVTIWAE